MKLHLAMLQRFIDLAGIEQKGGDTPPDVRAIRVLLEETVGEVKGILEEADRVVFTIETVANRGDHLSALGVARELSARLLSPLRPPAVASSLSDRKVSLPVRKTTDRCLRYALLEMTVPEAMLVRPDIATVVESSGERHGIVDLVNYVQLECGQPMHVFDREKVEGEILVAQLTAPESIVGLDGKEYRVPEGALVIRDAKKIIAIAGVIGCANSMVTVTTKKVLVESATFDPVTVRKTARSMGLSTDASHTFERGADVDMVAFALRRLLHLGQGARGSVKDATSCHALGYTMIEGRPVEKRRIPLRFGVVRKQINSPRFPEVEIVTRLKYLGFGIEGLTEKECQVVVPTWRLWDVATEEDLVEEIARSHGYGRIRIALPPIEAALPPLNSVEELLTVMEPVLIGSGFTEVITSGVYAESDVEIVAAIDPGRGGAHLRLKNAVERANAAMKVTNILALGDLIERNHRHGVLSAKVFELCRLFRATPQPDANYEYETEVLSLATSGPWFEQEWGKQDSLEDRLLHFKGVLEGLVRSLNRVVTVALSSKEPLLHPGYQAELRVGGTKCGFFGLVHPDIKEAKRYRHDLVYGELAISSLEKVRKERVYPSPSPFPSIRRDFTLKVPPREAAAVVVKEVRGLKLENLRDVVVVDQFQKGDEPFRRLTYRLTFQRPDRTLEHGEVDRDVESVLELLKSKLGVELAAS